MDVKSLVYYGVWLTFLLICLLMMSGAMNRKQPSPHDNRYVSKSKFLDGLQCGKLLWLRYNAKDRIPAPDEPKMATFAFSTMRVG
jgi:hypothetical protein